MTCAFNKIRQGGFTLIELMVAISIMAMMAVLSWRGLDGMTRAQALTSQRSDEVLTLQTGLAQWKVDLDMLTQTPGISNLDWDGRVLRLTRRTVPAGNGLVVVAWTRRSDLGGQWLRWHHAIKRLPSDDERITPGPALCEHVEEQSADIEEGAHHQPPAILTYRSRGHDQYRCKGNSAGNHTEGFTSPSRWRRHAASSIMISAEVSLTGYASSGCNCSKVRARA